MRQQLDGKKEKSPQKWEDLTGEEPEQKEKPSTPEGVDLSSLSPEDAELVRRILGASEAKKNAIRELL